jgi:plastocyanin
MMCRVAAGLVFVGFLTGCGSASTGPTIIGSGGGGSGAAVAIASGAATRGANAYVPNPLTITSGTTVTWTNNDTIAHTTTSDTQGVFDSGSIPAGGKFSRTFQDKGTVSYHCTIHPGMIGSVIVQ